MSQKPSKTPSIPLQAAEGDFWDLGDDDLDLDQEDVPKDEKTGKKNALAKEESPTPKPTQEEKRDQKTGDKAAKPRDEDEDEGQNSYKSSESAKTETKIIRKKESGAHETTKNFQPTTIFEKISVLLLIACLIGALSWGVSAFVREAPQGKIIPFIEDYPAKGEIVTISSVKTWWKKPVRTGENVDVGIVLEANLVPCARITLSEGGSTTLRVTFRNGEKQLIGDTINLIVKNGKFTLTGTDSVEVFSTAGFDNASKINSYANGDIDPWALIITEGNAGNESEPLVKARISADSNDQ